MSNSISIFQVITLCIASVGAVLGVINTWQALDKSRVKLKVVPKAARAIGADYPSIDFCVEVINLSAFAVTVDEVGTFHVGTKLRSVWVQPILIDSDRSWPRRLEPRTSVTVYGRRPQPVDGHRVRCLFAGTACGFVQEAPMRSS